MRHARALAAREQHESRLRQAATDLNSAMKRFSEELTRGETAGRLTSSRNWCSTLEHRRNELQAACDEARKNAEISRRELVVAAREREALDRVREKSLHAHEQAMRREEQQQFDEIASRMKEAAGPIPSKRNSA